MQIKEINVFTNGDALKLSTWSNFPYFFTETLEEKGIKVNRINTQPNKIFKTIYRFTIWQILKRTKKYDTYDYYRTNINRFFVNKIIKDSIKKYSNADVNLFLNFSFTAKQYSNKPTILFGDWTYEYFFPYFKNRKPSNLEQQFINKENYCIETADAVFVMFPKIATQMQKRYHNKNIFYPNAYFINTKTKNSSTEIIDKKLKHNRIIFIGTIKYKEGAMLLINATKHIIHKYPDIEIHIIGMKEHDFNILPKFVKCHGYLDKAKDSDREKYYDLMETSKLYVNTTPKWSAYSSAVEAMYFYTPIITTAYDDFVETFGKEIDFGIYNQQENNLSNEIINILENEHYTQLCVNSNLAVKDFTWSNYIDKFLEKISIL